MHYYWLFISGLANVWKQLAELTEENQAFQGAPEVETACQTYTTPILA
jgi:hypothetical protein